MLFFVVEERKAVEPDHPVCNAAFAKAVTHGLCNANNNLKSSLSGLDKHGLDSVTHHRRQDVRQGSC